MNHHCCERRQHSHSLLGVLAIAALGWMVVASYCTQCKRRRGRLPDAPEHIQTWEGEGGGVPVATNRTAAQVKTDYSSTELQEGPLVGKPPGAGPVAPPGTIG